MTEPLRLERTGNHEPEILGQSAWLRSALALIDRVAPTPLAVLLKGATGTGKELFARRIHARSGRSGRFMPVNCGALPRDVIESLLFGHRRGAFTGAYDSAPGFIEAAQGGTLYLDELSSLTPEGQVKLLRVLESKEVYRVGETEGRPVDFRVVASVLDDVAIQLDTGTFRLDLYQRVAGVVIELPPLRERDQDVLILARAFARKHACALAAGAAAVLEAYPWPGNARELRSVMERAAFLSSNGTIGPVALREAIALGGTFLHYPRASGGYEPGASDSPTELLRTCERNAWKARAIASALGLSRRTLFRRLRRAGISLRSANSAREASRPVC